MYILEHTIASKLVAQLLRLGISLAGKFIIIVLINSLKIHPITKQACPAAPSSTCQTRGECCIFGRRGKKCLKKIKRCIFFIVILQVNYEKRKTHS